LGCLATLHPAVERVHAAKGRPADKPLPLIIADWDMAGRFLRLDNPGLTLARKFWPGPLSIVTQVDSSISPLARDQAGRSAVRMTRMSSQRDSVRRPARRWYPPAPIEAGILP
jgi:Putative translation factor (SUA5)